MGGKGVKLTLHWLITNAGCKNPETRIFLQPGWRVVIYLNKRHYTCL